LQREEAGQAGPELKRRLGLFELTSTGVGIILGAGIYVVIGKAAGMAGGAVWASFLIGAVAAALTGLSYAELSSRFPRAAASYEYTRNAFGRRTGFVAGWLLLFATIIAASAVAIGFSGYMTSFIDTPIVPIAVVLVIASGVILFIGVKETVWVGVVFTTIELAGLLVVIAVSARFWGDGDYVTLPRGTFELFRAATLLFFAYTGFEQLATLSEETKEPRKTMPRAILIAIAVTTLLYVAVGFSSVSVLDWEVSSGSDAPLADVVKEATGVGVSRVVGYIALFATANTVLFLLLTGSRMLYGMARGGSLPSVLGVLLKGRGTPWVATAVATALAAVFVLPGDIEVVAQLTNFATITVFAMVNASLVWLRLTRKERHDGFRVPLNVRGVPVTAVLGIGVCGFMLAALEWDVWLYGLAIAAIGAALSIALRLPVIRRWMGNNDAVAD
jgi:APA family basic amino acid/polyamine antiporter